MPQTIGSCQYNGPHLFRKGPSSNFRYKRHSVIPVSLSANGGSTQPVVVETSCSQHVCATLQTRASGVHHVGSAALLIHTKPGASSSSYKPRDSGSLPPSDIMPGEPLLPSTETSQKDSASIPLKEIANWDGKSQDISRVLTAAFGAKDYLDCIKDLRVIGIDPQSYINSLDKVSTQLSLKATCSV